MFNTIEQTIFIEQKRYFGRIKVKKTLLKRYILKKYRYSIFILMGND